MEYNVDEVKEKGYQTLRIVASDFTEESDLCNIVVGIYSNGRGFISCKTKQGFPISIPIPFKEQGVWKYVEDPEGLVQAE